MLPVSPWKFLGETGDELGIIHHIPEAIESISLSGQLVTSTYVTRSTFKWA